jgi:hypothetical protein
MSMPSGWLSPPSPDAHGPSGSSPPAGAYSSDGAAPLLVPSGGDGPSVETLVVARLRLLQHLRCQVERQQRLIDDDDMDQLLRLLSEKQRCLDGLQRVEQMLKQRSASQPGRGDPAWHSCRQHWAQCDELVQQILHLEQAAADALQRLRDAAARRLQAFHGAQDAHAAYTAQGEPRGGQLDLTSGN